MSTRQYINEDAVIACVDLASRCGARELQFGYLHDDVPVEQAGWYAHISYQGARITVEDHQSPTLAAMALAQRLLAGATCRCGSPVTLSDGEPGCRWRLMGSRWESGCDAAPLKIKGARGDYNAMQRAMDQRIGNRAQRRAADRRKPRRS